MKTAEARAGWTRKKRMMIVVRLLVHALALCDAYLIFQKTSDTPISSIGRRRKMERLMKTLLADYYSEVRESSLPVPRKQSNETIREATLATGSKVVWRALTEEGQSSSREMVRTMSCRWLEMILKKTEKPEFLLVTVLSVSLMRTTMAVTAIRRIASRIKMFFHCSGHRAHWKREFLTKPVSH